MSRIAYVNGSYVSHNAAAVHIEDRGYQFGDGVYEVCEIRNGFIVDMTRHLDRLDRSLHELSIRWPIHRNSLIFVLREVIRRNRVKNGLVYLQVTRGVARRDHVFPDPSTPPALVITAKKTSVVANRKKAENGIKMISVPENRWPRVDIKTINLLPNAMARQQAREAGAQEAAFVDADGMITEGGATNIWLVNSEGELVTRPAEFGILRGITRTTTLDVADKLGLTVVERAFSVEEAMAAREVFVTSASGVAISVVEFDGVPIANGHPGSVAMQIRNAFSEVAELTAT